MKEAYGKRLERLRPQLMDFAKLLSPDGADDLVFLTFIKMHEREDELKDVLVLFPVMKDVCGGIYVSELKIKN